MPVFTIHELQEATTNGTLAEFISKNNDTFEEGLAGLVALYNKTVNDKDNAQKFTEAEAQRESDEYSQQVTNLNTRIATLDAEIQRLQTQSRRQSNSNTNIQELQNQIQQLRFQPARSHSYADPAKFGSTRRSAADLRSYIIDLQCKLRANGDWYHTEVERMTYVLSTLEGEARKHIDPHLDDAGEFTTLNSVEDILDILRNTFGNKFSREEAFARLQKEEQGRRPTAEFLASYLSLATTANSTGFDCTQRLLLAVHPFIRDRVLSDARYTSSLDLNALANLIREKDNINRAVYGAQYFKNSNNSSFTTTPVTPASDPDAMELDAMKVGGKYVWTWKDIENKTWAKTPELKAARKEFQVKYNLCHYCDDKTHTLQGCDKLKEARRKKEEREKAKAEDAEKA